MQCYKSLKKGEDSNSLSIIFVRPWESALIIKDLHNFYGGNHVSHHLSISKESLCSGQSEGLETDALTKSSLKPHSAKDARVFLGWHIWCPWVASTLSLQRLPWRAYITFTGCPFLLGFSLFIMLVQLVRNTGYLPAALSAHLAQREHVSPLPYLMLFLFLMFFRNIAIILTAYHKPWG